jgi:hypothetical protein
MTTGSPAGIRSFSATAWLAVPVSTTSLTMSDSSAGGLTTGSPADACCSTGGAWILESSAVNGLAGSCTNVPRPWRLSTRPWLVSSAIASRTVLRDASY